MYSTFTDLLVVMTVGLFVSGAVLSHLPNRAVAKRGKWLMASAFVIGAVVLVIRSQGWE
jgi:hypothetical protein